MKNYFFLIFFLFLISSCKEDPPVIPPPPQQKLTIAIDDVSCTEAWLNLKLENVTLPVDFELRRDSAVTKTFLAINTTDTTLYVDSLLLNQTYNFQLTSIQNPVSSNELSVTTLDTTKHNFTWQTFEFGQHSSSTLYDVVIIDENNIWAVGQIYMNDSLGNPENNAYNAVHWDGTNWEVKKISVLYRGNLITPELYGIFALSSSEIWLSSGVPVKGDGINWQQYHLFDMGILTQQDGYLTKIWGSSSSDIYFVGTLGTIAHYNGSQWTKIESGTTLDLFDVWGIIDGDERKVLCTAGSLHLNVQEKLLKINLDHTVDTLPWLTGRRINSIWFNSKYKTFACGDRIWIGDQNYNWVEQEIGSQSFVYKIRGNAMNDVFAVGAFGMATHYNGVNWSVIPQISSGAGFFSLAVKNSTVVIVGRNNSKAFIAVGTR